MGIHAGSNSQRPVGDAGRGRHTGSAGWIGGKHRKNDGCLGAALFIVGAGGFIIAGIGYSAVQIVNALF